MNYFVLFFNVLDFYIFLLNNIDVITLKNQTWKGNKGIHHYHYHHHYYHILLTHNWEPRQAKPCHQTLILLNVKLVQQGKKQGKSSLNNTPQQKLQTKHWTAAIMKTPGQQRLTTMKEALNDPKCKNNLLEGWMGRRPGKGVWQQEHWYITNKHMTIKTSHTLAHRLPNVCEKNVFHFFCSSARKQHIYFVERCQFRPNKGVSSHVSTPFHVSCYL